MAGIICFKVKWPLPRSPVNQLGKRGSFARRCCKCRPVQSRLSGGPVVLVIERGCRKQPSDVKGEAIVCYLRDCAIISWGEYCDFKGRNLFIFSLIKWKWVIEEDVGMFRYPRGGECPSAWYMNPSRNVLSIYLD